MNIAEIVSILTSAGIEPREANKEVKMLIEHFCNYTAKDIIMGNPLDYEKLTIVKEKAELRAKTKQPIQYIIGKSYFMGNYYKVTPDVLIPRDETELVTTHAINIINNNNFKEVLDIGTGSGCIACSISERCKCRVTASDISEKAIIIAKENAKNLFREIEFIHSDLFENLDNRKFDLIISNPPYIPKGTELQKEVTFEPSSALFTEEETGTYYYKKIIENAKKHLNPDGYIVFEIGINQAQLILNYFEENNYKNILIEKDFAGIERIASAQFIN